MKDRPSENRTDKPAGGAATLNPGDEARPGTTGTGEALCPDCGGSGRKGATSCPACGGSGRVVEGVGGA